MTRHETVTPPGSSPRGIADKEIVLATDLDGTLLGGTEEECARFYKWIQGNRARVGLIFVTGRDPGFINDLVAKKGVPRPDFIVGDVGTTVATMGYDNIVAPMAALEEQIATAWNDAGGRVQAAMHGNPGLTLQSNAFRYRVSFDMDPETFDDAAFETIAGMGLDYLMSDNKFLDILPKGVSKGPTLERLIAHLGIENRKVLVAGDTLNDLSMLALGLPAVAVGNSEPALIEKLQGMDHVHFAKGHGVSGIAEAIIAGGLLAAQKEAT